MKVLGLTLLMILASCGKDNKSGNAAPLAPVINPITNEVIQPLVGKWVGRCLNQDGNRRLMIRYEMNFFSPDTTREGLPSGVITYGNVEYQDRCEDGYQIPSKERKPDFYLVKNRDVFVNNRLRGVYSQVRLRIISSREIEFRGQRLIRELAP